MPLHQFRTGSAGNYRRKRTPNLTQPPTPSHIEAGKRMEAAEKEFIRRDKERAGTLETQIAEVQQQYAPTWVEGVCYFCRRGTTKDVATKDVAMVRCAVVGQEVKTAAHGLAGCTLPEEAFAEVVKREILERLSARAEQRRKMQVAA